MHIRVERQAPEGEQVVDVPGDAVERRCDERAGARPGRGDEVRGRPIRTTRGGTSLRRRSRSRFPAWRPSVASSQRTDAAMTSERRLAACVVGSRWAASIEAEMYGTSQKWGTPGASSRGFPFNSIRIRRIIARHLLSEASESFTTENVYPAPSHGPCAFFAAPHSSRRNHLSQLFCTGCSSRSIQNLEYRERSASEHSYQYRSDA